MAQDDEFGFNSSSLDVTVKVKNIDEVGEVKLSQRQPQVGTQITAMIEDDDNIVSSSLRWRWERSDVDGSNAPTAEACDDTRVGWTRISGANSATYMPTQGDITVDPSTDPNTETATKCLRAIASYTDGHGPNKSTSTLPQEGGMAEFEVRPRPNRNNAPEYNDQDLNTPGDQLFVDKSYAENDDKGGLVSDVFIPATDEAAGGGDPEDYVSVTDHRLTYSIEGSDVFTLVESTRRSPNG